MPENNMDWLGVDPYSPELQGSFFDPASLPARTYALPEAASLPPEVAAGLVRDARKQQLEDASYDVQMAGLKAQSATARAGAQALPEIAQLNPQDDNYPAQVQDFMSRNPLAMSDTRVRNILQLQDQAYGQRRQWMLAQLAERRADQALNADAIKEMHADPQLRDVYIQRATDPDIGPDGALMYVRDAMRDRKLMDELRKSGWNEKKAPLDSFRAKGRHYLDYDAVQNWISANAVDTKPPSIAEQRAQENAKTETLVKLAELMDPTKSPALPEDARKVLKQVLQAHVDSLSNLGSKGQSDNPLSRFNPTASPSKSPAQPQTKRGSLSNSFLPTPK